MRIPSCAPRPVPTSSAVGVASPRAHGQAMINTATAAVNAVAVVSPAASQNPNVGQGDGNHDRHEHCGDLIRQTLHRRLARLGGGNEAADLSKGRVGADARGSDHQTAAGVDRRTSDRISWSDLHRHRFTGEQRGVDGRRTFLDDAVRGDLLAGTHHEPVADDELLDRDADFGAVALHGDVLGSEIEQSRGVLRRTSVWLVLRGTGRRG